jgi:prepilin-type processing-associated H-X9-DG protein
VGFDWDKGMGPPANWFTKEKRLGEIFHCPADIWWGKTFAVDPSYGCNQRLTKAIPPAPLDTPRTKQVAVARPSEMILLADAGHVEEDGDAAWRIAPVQPGQAPLARHNGYGNVAWMDGHVTMESAARLEELHKEPYPFKHWLLSP